MINEYETQSTLNPKLWNGTELHPKLRLGLLKIARSFYKFLETDAPVLDIILIGSSANYNWTKFSDIDLHVVINYLQVSDNMHLVSNYMHAKKSVWNLKYPLKYKGMDIELYAQDSNENLHSTVGVFSVLKNKWLHKPTADTISIDDDAIEQKAKPYEYEIDSIKETDPTAIKKINKIKNKLRKLRQSGLDANGEYSVENMAFKHLRNKGYIERLNRLEQTISIGRLSIENIVKQEVMDIIQENKHADVTESLIMHVTGKKKLDATGWDSVLTQTQAVTDPMGQWRHPGKCTMIPTPYGGITMEHVEYDVLGIDDTGHMILMKPGQQYQYPGTQVFEIPHTAQWQTLIMQIQNSIQNGAIDAKW
jgi:hypothetical protein